MAIPIYQNRCIFSLDLKNLINGFFKTVTKHFFLQNLVQSGNTPLRFCSRAMKIIPTLVGFQRHPALDEIVCVTKSVISK